jgi:cytochrome c peroxidase
MARRELFSWASCAVSAASSPIFAAPASAVGIDYTAVRSDIGAVIAKDKNKGPTLLRLAWHSSGTYDKMQKDGGSGGGSIRFDEELAHGANAGLKKAVGWMEPIAKKHKISHADLYTLAGVVAIESAGGPSIPWRAGRVDAMDPKTSVTPDGRLPAADKGNPMATAQGLRDVFYRMGFGDQEIVALAGAHALGRCHADASGYVGPWSPTVRM